MRSRSRFPFALTWFVSSFFTVAGRREDDLVGQKLPGRGSLEQRPLERRAVVRVRRLEPGDLRLVDEVDPRVRGIGIRCPRRDVVVVDPDLAALLRDDVLRRDLPCERKAVAVPAEAHPRLALGDERVVVRGVERDDVRLQVEEHLLDLVELLLVLGVVRVPEHRRDRADDLRGASRPSSSSPYFFVSATNSFQVVGRSLILSVRYMKPVVPQSFTTEYVPFGSSDVLRNFGSTFFVTFLSCDQSSGRSRFSAMSSFVM